jgi:hypothetical protein
MDFTIANKLNCDIIHLHKELSIQKKLDFINQWLKNYRVVTLYKNRNQQYKEFQFHFITPQNASKIQAYGQKARGPTVEQHYFVRHRITLIYPHNPCLVHINNKKSYFYPLELVTLVRINNQDFGRFRTLENLERKHFVRHEEYIEYLRLLHKNKIGKQLDLVSIKQNAKHHPSVPVKPLSKWGFKPKFGNFK